MNRPGESGAIHCAGWVLVPRVDENNIELAGRWGHLNRAARQSPAGRQVRGTELRITQSQVELSERTKFCSLRSTVYTLLVAVLPGRGKMRAAYHADSALLAEVRLNALARELDKTHPPVAASLREGMAEGLTVLRLGVPPTLARTLRSTNAIESMIGVCRQRSANVKRWPDGQMPMRWCAAGMVEAGKQFRRVNGHLHLPTLRAALEHEVAETVGGTCHDDLVSVA